MSANYYFTSGRLGDRISGRVSELGLSGRLSGRMSTGDGSGRISLPSGSGRISVPSGSGRISGRMKVPSGRLPSGDIAILDSWLSDFVSKDTTAGGSGGDLATVRVSNGIRDRMTGIAGWGELGLEDAAERKRKRNSSLRSHLSTYLNIDGDMYDFTAPSGAASLPKSSEAELDFKMEEMTLRPPVGVKPLPDVVKAEDVLAPNSLSEASRPASFSLGGRKGSKRGPRTPRPDSAQAVLNSQEISPVTADGGSDGSLSMGSSPMPAMKPSVTDLYGLRKVQTLPNQDWKPIVDQPDPQQQIPSQGPSASPLQKPRGRVKRYKNAQPSKFCHVCSRCDDVVQTLVCGNIQDGSCRKVVCEKCFEKYKWDWAGSFSMGEMWACPHCRQCCPEKARCGIYHRTNMARTLANKIN